MKKDITNLILKEFGLLEDEEFELILGNKNSEYVYHFSGHTIYKRKKGTFGIIESCLDGTLELMCGGVCEVVAYNDQNEIKTSKQKMIEEIERIANETN